MIENEFSRKPEKPYPRQNSEPSPEKAQGTPSSGHGHQAEGSSRILNRNLFSDPNAAGKASETSIRAQLPQLMQTENKIHDVKNQLGTLAEHLGQWTQNYAEFVKNCQLRFERIAQTQQRFENNNQALANELNQKFSRINDRFAERKSVDSKIQEMMDRHNSVLKSFELRMHQMQKLLADKEALLISTQGALNEAKMEIARLKRL